jgi:DNA primase
VTIEDFVKTYGGKYRSYKGGYILQCPLPEHSDNSPSFSLSTTGLFKCWGCGASGNYTFLLNKVAGYSWKRASETVGYLNLRKKWVPKKIPVTVEKRYISSAILGLYDVDWQRAAMLYAARQDDERRPPWALVFDKGFHHRTLTHFQAGYDPEDQRITIPVWDEGDRLLGLLGRACRQGTFKYCTYQKFQYTEHVYNLQATREGEPVVLVEGAFDVWMLWQWKVPLTAIATMTSHASEMQIAQILAKHREIAIFYDHDPAGWKGAAKVAKDLSKRGARVDIIDTAEGVRNIKDMTHATFTRQYHRRRPYPCLIGDADSPHNKATVPSRRALSQGR